MLPFVHTSVLLMAACSVVSAIKTPHAEKDHLNSGRDIEGTLRSKRAGGAAAFILRQLGEDAISSIVFGAVKKSPIGSIPQKYIKRGGYEKALQDFRNVHPTSLKTRTATDGATTVYGRVGDVRIILKSADEEFNNGSPVIKMFRDNIIFTPRPWTMVYYSGSGTKNARPVW